MPQEKICRLLTLEPLHIGVGQVAQGEVDLPIERDNNKVPCIRGKSLKGAFRSAVLSLARQAERQGKPVPPFAQVFGLASGEAENGHEGLVGFKDASLAFFPAATSKGTLWFTTPGRAALFFGMGEVLCLGTHDQEPDDELDEALENYPDLSFGQGRCLAPHKDLSNFQIGWFKFSDIPLWQTVAEEKAYIFLQEAMASYTSFFPEIFWQDLKNRLIFLDETTFYRVVETNLERRTGNKIDALTGAVEEHMLYNYEALPKNCLFSFRLSCDEENYTPSKEYADLLSICETAREGLVRHGIGGMKSSGFGSIFVEPLLIKIGK